MHPTKFGIGQPVTRKEDDALLRGAGRYGRPRAGGRAARGGAALAACACALSHHGCREGARAAGRARWCSPAPTPQSSATCRARGRSPERQDRGAALSDAGARRGAPCRRRGRLRGRRHDRAGARRRRGDRGRMGAAAARDRRRRGAQAGAPQVWPGARPAISRSRRRSAMRARPRRRLRRRRARCRSRSSTSASSPIISIPAPSSPNTTRAPRPPHADARQPGQPCRARRAVRSRAQDRARQDARGDARRRRRLRHEAVSLSRIRAGRRRRAAAQAAGQMGRRPQRAFPRRHAGPRQHHHREARARRRGHAFSRSKSTSSPTWAPISRATRRSFLYRRRHVAGRLRHSRGLPRARARRLSPTPCRSTPIAAPGGRRRPM